MQTTEYENILIDTTDGITTVTLNRPEAKNAMSPALHADMFDALSKLQHDPDTEVLVITGAGDSFSAGQDLRRYFWENRDNPAAHEHNQWMSHEWRHRMLSYFPKPTIAAVNGWCFGGALTIVHSCDIVIAADDAIFGLSEINWGTIPGGLVAKVVVEMMPPRQALYYAMTGEQFTGKTALELGVATLSVPRSDLVERTLAIAKSLQSKDPIALRAVKTCMKSVDLKSLSYEDAHRWLQTVSGQLKAWNSVAGSAGGDDGIQRFLAKEYRPGFDAKPASET